MFKYLIDYNAVLQEKFSDEKLKSTALAIKISSTIVDIVFWLALVGSFTLNSYINFIVFVVCSYLLVYQKIGVLSMNWITWHELTKEEKLQLQKEEYYSIVRQMLEHNEDSAVFVAHVQHLKEQENKEIELKNKEEVFHAIDGAGYESMLKSFEVYKKTYSLYTKVAAVFFMCFNALLFTYSFNGQDYLVSNTPFAQLSMMNLILSMMSFMVFMLMTSYLVQFIHSPDDAPASCAQDYYLADFIRVISMHKKEFENFKQEKGRCLSVADMMSFKEQVVRD